VRLTVIAAVVTPRPRRRRLGFERRVRGSHHILTKQGIVEILNLQPKGDLAKPYQVKQVRSLITAYGLLPRDNEEQGEEK